MTLRASCLQRIDGSRTLAALGILLTPLLSLVISGALSAHSLTMLPCLDPQVLALVGMALWAVRLAGVLSPDSLAA